MSRPTATSFSLHGIKTDDMKIHAHVSEGGTFWIRMDFGIHDINLFVDTIEELHDLCRLFGISRINMPKLENINE